MKLCGPLGVGVRMCMCVCVECSIKNTTSKIWCIMIQNWNQKQAYPYVVEFPCSLVILKSRLSWLLGCCLCQFHESLAGVNTSLWAVYMFIHMHYWTSELYLLFVKCVTEIILTRKYQISKNFRTQDVSRTRNMLVGRFYRRDLHVVEETPSL